MFKENIQIDKAINMIIWTFDGFSLKEHQKIKEQTLEDYEFKEAIKQMDEYLLLMAICFYKDKWSLD